MHVCSINRPRTAEAPESPESPTERSAGPRVEQRWRCEARGQCTDWIPRLWLQCKYVRLKKFSIMSLIFLDQKLGFHQKGFEPSSITYSWFCDDASSKTAGVVMMTMMMTILLMMIMRRRRKMMMTKARTTATALIWTSFLSCNSFENIWNISKST